MHDPFAATNRNRLLFLLKRREGNWGSPYGAYSGHEPGYGDHGGGDGYGGSETGYGGVPDPGPDYGGCDGDRYGGQDEVGYGGDGCDAGILSPKPLTLPIHTYDGGFAFKGNGFSSGLSNSVRFMVDALVALGVAARMVELYDNTYIDRAIRAWRPTHAILEAFWCTPQKLDELKRLHPGVRWILRDHSETPFVANEGIAIEWTKGYLARGVEIMCNSRRAQADMRAVAVAHGFPEALVTYGPNVYPEPGAATLASRPGRERKRVVDVGCFGAIRPLKNHLTQAIAALMFVDAAGVRLRFHVNGTRVEGGAHPVPRNLRALFRGAHSAELVEHGWLAHGGFLRLLGTVDIALQVSFTETFNVVAADAMTAGVPLVTSSDVPWLGDYAHADPSSARDICTAMLRIWEETDDRAAVRLQRQRRDLMAYCHASERVWLRRFGCHGMAGIDLATHDTAAE